METKTKTFDAVAESRKWREASSRKLNAMNRDERLIYLQSIGQQVLLEFRRPETLQPSTFKTKA